MSLKIKSQLVSILGCCSLETQKSFFNLSVYLKSYQEVLGTIQYTKMSAYFQLSCNFQVLVVALGLGISNFGAPSVEG